jgi:hypothetical protein
MAYKFSVGEEVKENISGYHGEIVERRAPVISLLPFSIATKYYTVLVRDDFLGINWIKIEFPERDLERLLCINFDGESPTFSRSILR